MIELLPELLRILVAMGGGKKTDRYPEKPIATVAAEVIATKMVKHPTNKAIKFFPKACLTYVNSTALFGNIDG